MREKWKHLPTQKQKQMRSPGNHNKQNHVLFFFLPYFFSILSLFFSRDKWPHRSSYGAPSLPALVLLFFFLYPRESDARRDTDTRADTLEKPLTRLAAVLRGDPGHAAKRNGLD